MQTTFNFDHGRSGTFREIVTELRQVAGDQVPWVLIEEYITGTHSDHISRALIIRSILSDTNHQYHDELVRTATRSRQLTGTPLVGYTFNHDRAAIDMVVLMLYIETEI
jgi:hypothetical protein